jgi:hypothetical protein
LARIVVSGMVAGDPHQGGATWAVLQYVLGLKRLGHDVCLVEPVDEVSPAISAYFGDVVTEFGLADRSALLDRTSGTLLGARRERFRGADLLLNVSGMLVDDVFLDEIPLRVYLDLDPGFNQLWHDAEGIDVGFGSHTHFVTVGQAIGEPECLVPDCGKKWIGTVQPVVLERWPVAARLERDALTTVGNWRGYGSIEHGGRLYGQKAHSLRSLMKLPTLTDERFELALAIHPDETRDLEALAANGWILIDPVEAAGTPGRYHAFVQGSKAELGIAKSGYVLSSCGWFSDRSVCYLASGRPVIAQETGFSRYLPAGDGLLAFETVEDVLAALDELRSDYERHRRAARALAEEHFDSDKVLRRLLSCL